MKKFVLVLFLVSVLVAIPAQAQDAESLVPDIQLVTRYFQHLPESPYLSVLGTLGEMLVQKEDINLSNIITLLDGMKNQKFKETVFTLDTNLVYQNNGNIFKFTTWLSSSSNQWDYTFGDEVMSLSGVSPNLITGNGASANLTEFLDTATQQLVIRNDLGYVFDDNLESKFSVSNEIGTTTLYFDSREDNLVDKRVLVVSDRSIAIYITATRDVYDTNTNWFVSAHTSTGQYLGSFLYNG